MTIEQVALIEPPETSTQLALCPLDEKSNGEIQTSEMLPQKESSEVPELANDIASIEKQVSKCFKKCFYIQNFLVIRQCSSG